ncbi:MAG: hypothetical protein KC978_24240 [Candidatus Omnitrophica bacterium]|nr:hypothetical protein [Candidatus Omnitrophota bacterium]
MIEIGIAALSALALIGIAIWTLRDPDLKDHTLDSWKNFGFNEDQIKSNSRWFSWYLLIIAIGIFLVLLSQLDDGR